MGTLQNAHSQPLSLVEAARVVLEQHIHFRGRLDRFTLLEADGAIVIQGAVPTFYLKQLLQALLRDVKGVERVINRVEVVCGHGLSGCSQQTRERCALEYAWLGKRPECFPTCQGTPGDPQDLAPQFVSNVTP
jgi:hypothetical protein